MEQPLYLQDSYLKEFEAEVKEVNGNFVVLDKTAFYPVSGGQPSDTGFLRTNTDYKVVLCKKMSGKINHEVDKEGLKVGDKVKGLIDWERRHKLMRMHTAAHILSEIIHKDTGAMITGNQLDIDKSRIDFSLGDYNPELVKSFVEKANEALVRDLQVTSEVMPREQAMKLPQVSKLAKGLPDFLTELRIVNIGDFDIQADAGTHVKSTKEVGQIDLIKCENKGKNFRRLYFALSD